MKWPNTSKNITITLSRSQARWDSNTWVLSLRSDFSPRITAPYVGVMLQGETLKYLSPNISKFDYIILLIKLIVAITVIFISAKIYYELNKVESFPSYLSNLLFILVCVLIAWLYRIDFKYQFSEPDISARVRYNLLGFVNISAQLDDGQTQKIRLWNPTSSSLQLSEKYKLEFIFKASSDNSNTGCRVVVLDNAT